MLLERGEVNLGLGKMDKFQKLRKNTDFLIKCMAIKRCGKLTEEFNQKLRELINQEEESIIINRKFPFKGQFHKLVLNYLSSDKRVIEFMKYDKLTNKKLPIYYQLGVIEALRDYFNLNDAFGRVEE